MRRRALKLTILVLVLTLNLSFISALMAKTAAPNQDIIIEKLQQLQTDVSGLPLDAFRNPALADNRINTLENKLGAVIHQVQAGAYNGSINKLQNDVKNAVINWITPEYAEDLIKKIDEIIDLIKGIQPPPPPPPKPDFAVKASPNTLVIEQNKSAQSTVIVQSLNGFNQTVSLNITSAPISGVSTTLIPFQVKPPVNGTADATLTVKAAVNAVPNTYAITVQGTNGTVTRLVNITLTVTPILTEPDFTISAQPGSIVVQQGGSNNSVISVTSLVGFSQPVNLTITSMSIVGVNVTVQPSPVIPAPNQSALSILTVNAANSTVVGNYTLIVTGSSGLLRHSVSVRLMVKETVTPPPPPPKDATPPTIASVQRAPAQPAYNESVTVTAFVYDVESGVKQVRLNYSRGFQSTLVNMTLVEGLFRAVIPPFAYNATVEYRVIAADNAGNTAYSSLYSYTVTDPYPPLLQIDSPLQGSYVSGTVPITVFMKDQNNGSESGFARAELTINGAIVNVWNAPAPVGPVTYYWNTAQFGPDDVYTIQLRVDDQAGNTVSKSQTVTVDNTLPTAIIESPANGSFLRGTVLVKVVASDLNFDMMELRIDNVLVEVSLSSGRVIVEWDTLEYADRMHSVALTVFDKAGSSRELFINVLVDNSAPSIGVPSWLPREPAADVPVQVNVTVFEPTFGSGVANVTLWYRNATMEDWLPLTMEFAAGNWTETIRNQSDTVVEFYVEAFDNSGNHNQTDRFDFTVAGPVGFQLVWLLLIIIILLAILGGAALYLWARRRRKKREETGTGGAPSGPVPPEPSTAMVEAPKPSVSEAAAVVAAPSPAVATVPLPSRGYSMVSFLVAAHNEEGTISKRIGTAFERAASHKGPSEVIVVDDGSQDSTYELAWDAVKANRAKYPNVPAKVVKLSTYMGKEEAIRFGSRKATGEIIETVNGETTPTTANPTIPAIIGHLLLTL
jgi:hypothetical protein